MKNAQQNMERPVLGAVLMIRRAALLPDLPA
jgi:hypothetical protein